MSGQHFPICLSSSILPVNVHGSTDSGQLAAHLSTSRACSLLADWPDSCDGPGVCCRGCSGDIMPVVSRLVGRLAGQMLAMR